MRATSVLAHSPTALGIMPTGAGKTILFAKLAERFLAGSSSGVLVLAHREELVDQAADKIFAATGIRAGIEMADRHAVGDEQVIVASVQTMASRLEDWPRDHFDLLILDEAHHAVSPTWRRVIEHFQSARVFGVTATPDRSDKRKLGEIFSQVAFEVHVTDLIKGGYLCPVFARKLDVKVDMRALRTKDRDVSADEAADALKPHLFEVACQLKEQAHDRKLMVFLPDVATSVKMTAAMAGMGLQVQHVCGTSRDRAEVLEWFRKPGPRVLCNAMLLTEGFDQPDVNAICCLRPTKSRSLYAQIVGRGMRLAIGKESLLLLDPLWLTGDHSLCQPADIAVASPEMRTRVQQGLDQGLSMQQAEERARKSLEETLEQRIKKAAKMRTPKGLVNPFLLAIAMGDGDIADYEPTLPWHELPATSAQVGLLQYHQIHIPEDGIKAGLADALLQRIQARQRMGLATPKQLQLLRRHRIPNAEMLSVGEASVQIAKLITTRFR
jgi:superfamily II DNA or RNA helicase